MLSESSNVVCTTPWLAPEKLGVVNDHHVTDGEVTPEKLDHGNVQISGAA
jgi:hypothetical protein